MPKTLQSTVYEYHEAIEHLRALTEALNTAFISTWQSTYRWQTELDAATEYLKRVDSKMEALESNQYTKN